MTSPKSDPRPTPLGTAPEPRIPDPPNAMNVAGGSAVRGRAAELSAPLPKPKDYIDSGQSVSLSNAKRLIAQGVPLKPLPEPWKVALAEALRSVVATVIAAGYTAGEIDYLALISKHHDPSCPTPTRTEEELLRRALSHALYRNHEVSDGCSACAEGKALEVKP